MNRFVMISLFVFTFSIAGYPGVSYPGQEKGSVVAIQKGNEVTLHYTLVVDGQTIYNSAGEEPLQYTHGEGKIIPGLARQLEGMKAGEEKTIEIAPEEAYGKVDPRAFQEVPKSKLPSHPKPQVDMSIEVKNPDGGTISVRIADVKEDTVIIDFNHPLAGKVLTYHVKIDSVK